VVKTPPQTSSEALTGKAPSLIIGALFGGIVTQEESSDASMVDDRSEGASVRSVQRALDILALLTDDRPSVTTREIVTETGLAKTTVIRLTRTLEQLGLLWGVPQGYMAGPALWRWAHLAQKTWELQPETRKDLRDLADRHRETVNLYVRRDIFRVCIAQQESPEALRHVVRIGDELPMWAGASAKILLSRAPEAFLERVADASPDGRSALARLRREVAKATHDGFAVSRGEREAGLSAIGVPVRGRSGDVVAALTLSGPSVRFGQDRIPDFIEDLQRCSAAMSKRGFDHPLAVAI
jgi:DNA-binding IclR family transcriptional regulator